MINSSSRMQYLDGLRGVACLTVMIGHYTLAFHPAAALLPFCNGNVAVAIFFLMSGFVLTDGFGQLQYRVAPLIASRVFRLLAPTFVAISGASALYWIFQPTARAAALTSGSHWFFLLTQAPNIMEFPGELLASIVGFSDTSMFRISSFITAAQSSDSPIWTISYELYGSAVTLALARIYRIQRPWWYLAAVVLLCIFGVRDLGLFVIGHIARIAYREDAGRRFDLVAIGIGAASLVVFYVLPIDLSFPRPILAAAVSGFTPHGSAVLAADDLVGILVFFIVIFSRSIQSVLSAPALLCLGRISFSIYLIHWPILLGFGSSLYLLFGGSPAAAWTAMIAGATVTLILAVAFERYIDAPAIALSRRIKERSYATLNPEKYDSIEVAPIVTEVPLT